VELPTLSAIAGPAAQRIAIVNGVLDASQLTAADLSSNEGALLLHQLATSPLVFSYSEITTGDASVNKTVAPDWRYMDRGEDKPINRLPPLDVDAAITVNSAAKRYGPASLGKPPVSTAALAFHELAEAYGQLANGWPVYPRPKDPRRPQSGSVAEPSGHYNALYRELILMGQRTRFTDYPGGGELSK